MTSTHQRCRWPGCEKLIEPTHWGCLEHWERLPQGLRDGLSHAKFGLGRAKTSEAWEGACAAATKWAKGAASVSSIQTEPSETHVLEPVPFPCCYGTGGKHKPACPHAPR